MFHHRVSVKFLDFSSLSGRSTFGWVCDMIPRLTGDRIKARHWTARKVKGRRGEGWEDQRDKLVGFVSQRG